LGLVPASDSRNTDRKLGNMRGTAMQIGMLGLGRMGANMTRRLIAGGHRCVAFDLDRQAVEALSAAGARGVGSLRELIDALERPRRVWIMIPAAAVDPVVSELAELLAEGDVVIDGGNSHYADDLRRSAALAAKGIHYVDVGVSGGVWGIDHGFCQMIGGEPDVVAGLDPLFSTLAPGRGDRDALGAAPAMASARSGYLHCGSCGAGHFVKMVHNGVEYGLMAAYAEGFNLLRNAGVGLRARRVDAETAPLTIARNLAYDLDLPAIAELWRHGSVVRSWLLDLLAAALSEDPRLESSSVQVADSGEGRWTVGTAVDAGVPVPVLATALFARFGSRDRDDFANRVLSALRREFGGHSESAPQATGT
jgi:6-phosphogluconate dehydrogenase